jgi:hypothetical protein
MMASFALIPLLVFYLVPIAFVIWFAITFIKVQRERNDILRKISDRLKNKHT